MSQKQLLTRISQIGLVVRNAEATAKRCQEDFGIGPWAFYTFDPSNVSNMTVHGKRVDHAMRTGHARIGDIDWEIIEPLDDKSIYAEHLRTRGEGIHHILFASDDYAQTMEHMRAKGFDELTSGVWGGRAYSYFDAQRTLGCIAEFFAPPVA